MLAEALAGQGGEQTPGHVRAHRLVFLLVLSGGRIRTLEQVMVKGLVGRQHGRHLVVVGRMDVLIDAVARELHLPQREGSGILPGLRGGGRRADHPPSSQRRHTCLFQTSPASNEDREL